MPIFPGDEYLREVVTYERYDERNRWVNTGLHVERSHHNCPYQDDGEHVRNELEVSESEAKSA